MPRKLSKACRYKDLGKGKHVAPRGRIHGIFATRGGALPAARLCLFGWIRAEIGWGKVLGGPFCGDREVPGLLPAGWKRRECPAAMK